MTSRRKLDFCLTMSICNETTNIKETILTTSSKLFFFWHLTPSSEFGVFGAISLHVDLSFFRTILLPQIFLQHYENNV